MLATHTPVGLRPVIQAKVAAYRSYIIGVRVKDIIEDALYWDMDEPYHYMRLAEDEKGPLLLIGGEDHKTGEGRRTQTHFDALIDYARQRYDVSEVDYQWSSQLYEPADGLPYIGKSALEPNVYIATGYSGEGLTCGTIAGQLIADDLLGKPNRWAKLYNPNRIKPLASAASMISENTDAAMHFIGDRLKFPAAYSFQEIAPGEGKLTEVDGRKLAVYRDEQNDVHVLSPVCTHAKCIVNWNQAEKSWDCPCHGGRFTPNGDVIEGPPTVGLEKIQL